MQIRFPIPTLILLFGITWMARGWPTHPFELLPTSVVSRSLQPSTIGGMRPGDVLTARYKSDGCFHHITARLTITRAKDGTVQASVYAQGESLTEMGVLRRTLSVAEVNTLDEILGIYRNTKQKGYCTTQTTLRFGLYHDGRHLLANQTVLDGTCVLWWRDVPVSFDALVYEALEAGLW